MKLMAEVQLLRDNKQYRAAYDLLAQAAAKDPRDTDLLYDQAMLAEKLDDFARDGAAAAPGDGSSRTTTTRTTRWATRWPNATCACRKPSS
jgi:hypothetical protein